MRVPVFVDDIIIGFAERGEQVLNAPLGRNNLGGAAFVPNRDYEPRGFDQNENEEGRFQLEIRTAHDYGISYKFDSPAVPPPADYRLLRTYDTNYRAAPTLGLEVPAAAQIADGTLFTLNGGSTAVVTFEFNVLKRPGRYIGSAHDPWKHRHRSAHRHGCQSSRSCRSRCHQLPNVDTSYRFRFG